MGEASERSEAEILSFNYFIVFFQPVRVVVLCFFIPQTTRYVKARRDGQLDKLTVLTFLFLGLQSLFQIIYVIIERGPILHLTDASPAKIKEDLFLTSLILNVTHGTF